MDAISQVKDFIQTKFTNLTNKIRENQISQLNQQKASLKSSSIIKPNKLNLSSGIFFDINHNTIKPDFFKDSKFTPFQQSLLNHGINGLTIALAEEYFISNKNEEYNIFSPRIYSWDDIVTQK